MKMQILTRPIPSLTGCITQILVVGGVVSMLQDRAMAEHPVSAEKANIILIMADDLGYGDLSCFGNTVINTPNLDNMARNGIRFTDYHANGAVCSPTRAAILTGRYQQRAGFDAFPPEFPKKPYRQQDGLALKEITFAEALKPAGYQTAIFGKWHLGWPAEYNPILQGFDELKGFLSGNVDHFSHISQEGQDDWWSGDRKVHEKGYVTDLLTQYSLKFIEENKDRPFCLYLAHECPHYPWQGPFDEDRAQRKAKDIPAPGNLPQNVVLGDRPHPDVAMKEMVERMDAGIGQIMAKLKELGIENNTFIFFCSDNGAWPCKGVGSNGPLGGIKGDLFEGGHRVPAIAYWPGTIKPGISRQTVMSMDLFPTMLSIADQPVPNSLKLDGTDLMPLLLEGEELPHRTLFWHFGTQRAVRKGPWKLVKGVIQNPNKFQSGIKGNFLSLYNLDNDLGEKEDLSGSHTEIVQQLLHEIAIWEQDIHSSLNK